MSRLIKKSHNVSILIYHIVFPTKYRRVVITEEVDQILREICLEIESRYEIEFLEIGTDKDHVHFMIQSVPTYSPTQLVTMIKSLTAKEMFKRAPFVKKQLWGGKFWTSGYYIGTVGQNVTEKTIKRYIQRQGREKEYEQLHVKQLPLFE